MMVRWRYRSTLVALLAAGGAALAIGPRAAHAQTPSDSVRHLSLDDALRAAEATSEDVNIALAGVTRAQGQQVKARSLFLPQIYGSASYTRTLQSQFQALSGFTDTTAGPPNCNEFHPDSTAPLLQRVSLLEHALGCTGGGNFFGAFSKVGFGSANQYNLGLSLSENLFAGGRNRAQLREANATRRSADINLTATRAQALLTVAQAYYDAVLSDRLVSIAEATLAQAETTLAQTRLARQVGNQPEFDLLRAQVTRDNQVPVVIQQRASRDRAYVHLRQLLGISLAQPLMLTTSLGDTAAAPATRLASILETQPDTAVNQRAPVRQANENVEAQRNAITVAHAQRIPTLTLSSAYGRVAYPPGGFPSWNAFLPNWTITATLQVPLYTGGSIHGDEMIAAANLREAEAQLRQTRQLAELDTRNALDQLGAAQAAFAASQGTVGQATQAYQIAELRYREGISTQTELTDSRIQLQQAQANRAQASRDLQVARLRVALLRDLPLSTQPSATTPTLQTQTTTTPLTTPAPTSPGQPQGVPTAAPAAGGVVTTNRTGGTP